MPFLSWRKWYNRSTGRKARSKKQQPRFQKCFLEILEDRVLLSGQTFIVNATGDAGVGSGNTGDIRYCINQADQPVNAGSTITFSAIPGGVITLTHGELQISQDTTITGPGASALTISGGNNSRVFDVTSQNAQVTISGLTITNGNASPANIWGGGQRGRRHLQ